MTVPASAAPPAPETGPAAAAATPPAQTPQQAAAQAQRTKQPVEVAGSTTATDRLVANADGTFTLTRMAVPARKRVGGQWRDLDATLASTQDGQVAPLNTTGGLRLSGGGAGPLATLTDAGQTFALTLPMALPKPTLHGASALYAAVLPGVDLRVTVDRQGGFQQVFVVHDAAAAANPKLADLAIGARGQGLSVEADEAGNLSAKDQRGHVRFAAAAPTMWDSSKGPAAKGATAIGSGPAGPGTGAKVARSGVKVTARSAGETTIGLTPDRGLLTATDTQYPVYIDPTWTPVGADRSGWATVAQQFSSTKYWNSTPDPDGHMQVGNSGGIYSHTLVNFPIPVSTLAGATIDSARFYLTNVYSWSCTATRAYVHAPSMTLSSSNANWTSWDGQLGAAVTSEVFAHGYNSTCPAAGAGFDVAATIRSAAASGKTVQTFGLTAVNETTSDHTGYKEFSPSSAKLEIKYNHAPSAPSALSTSPATACPTSTPSAVGDGPVSLYARVDDADGNNLGVAFKLWKTSDASETPIASSTFALTYPARSDAVLVVSESTLKGAAGSAITQFSWKVQTNDEIATGPWSATCTFAFDPTRTGAPVVTAPASSTIAQPASFTVTKPVTGTVPSGYLYQLNGGPAAQVVASGGSAGITVTPNRATNVLTVTSLSAGSNIGDTATVIFNSHAAAPAIDQDTTGDGFPDLHVVGAAGGLPAGLWQAAGKPGGTLQTNATNVGIYGNGVVGDNAPADFTGAQAVTGRFTGGGLQDHLIYYPAGANPGSGMVIDGTGDGSALQAHRGYEKTISAGTLEDINYANPIQLANAGNSSHQDLVYPDLISISGNATVGYYLSYYASQNGINNYQFPAQLGTSTPTGGTDWNTWSIVSSQVATGTSVFLWQRSSGALYLWTGLSFDINTQALTYTQYRLSTSWNAGATTTLQAADVNGDGTADLWTAGPSAGARAWLVSNLSGTTGTITGQTVQTLNTAAHHWSLNDLTGSTAADSVGTLTATATAGATSNTGDLFSPDVKLNGSNGTLTTASPAVSTNNDFSVSVWVKPTAAGGVVLSQDGSQTAGFKLWADGALKAWRFGLTTSDTANPTIDSATAASGSVQPGVWVELTATYRQAGGILNLYVNGVNVATATHPVSWNATGKFRVGASATQGTAGEFFSGQVANVQTWNQRIDPAQATSPAGYYQTITPTRFLNTLSGPATPVGSNSTVKLAIAGVGGIASTGVTAVAVNATVVSPTSFGYLTLFPTGTPQPATSNIYFESNAVLANYAIVPVGADGTISIFHGGTGTVHVLIDVSGYFTSDAAKPGNSSFQPLNPTRILDTRSGLGTPVGALNHGGTIAVQVGGANGIPAGITAVAINLTSANANSGGYLVARADGPAVFGTSGLQMRTGVTMADLAIVAVATNGKIDISMYGVAGGHTDVIGDVVGYFIAGTGGQKYHALNATRVLDTRQDNTPIAPNGFRAIAQGNNVIANDATLVMNIIVTQGTTAGYAVAYANGTAAPAASTVNWYTGQTVGALALPKTGNGTTNVYNASSGSTHIVVDCLGYFAGN